MAADDSLASRNHQLLKDILEQLRELNETISSFTSEGLPLRAQVPTAELLASLLAAAALISKERPVISQQDLSARVAAAQVLADELLRQHDGYRTTTQTDRLNQLAQS